MNQINHHHITNAIKAITDKNVIIWLNDVFLTSFLTNFFSIYEALIKSFDHKSEGTTFVSILKFLFLIIFSQLHSCSALVSFSVRFVKAFAHINKSEK